MNCEGRFFNLVGLIMISGLTTACYQLERKWTEEAFERSEQATIRAETYPTCCESPSEIHFRPLQDARIIADFAPGFSQMRNFGTGRSYFIGIDLSAVATSEAIYLQIELTNGGRGSIPTLFVPSMKFYDESYRLTRMPIEPPLCFYRGWRREDVGYFAKISELPEGTRYLVVYTDQRALGRSIQYSGSATTSVGGALPLDVSVRNEYPRSLEGVVQIWAGANRTLEEALDKHCRWL